MTITATLAASLAVSLAALTACHPERAPAPADSPSDQDQLVSQLEGVWAGNDNRTPFGPIQFAFSFERQPDGSLHAHTGNGSDFSLDLRLGKDDAGRWLMREEGTVRGLGTQRHTLALASASHKVLTFRDAERPDELQVRIELVPGAMVFEVTRQGKEHILLNLPRLEGAAADRVRQTLAAQR
jgi:hypothetical protein